MKKIFTLAIALITLPLPVLAQITPSVPVQVSVGIGNTAPDGRSSEPVLPPNGDITVFKSLASNLVAGDTNQSSDIFMADANNALTRVSVSSTGEQANADCDEPAISPLFPDGAFAVAFSSLATNLVPELGPTNSDLKQVYLRIPALNKTILVSRATSGNSVGGDNNSASPSVTSIEVKGGRRYIVAYSTAATNVTTDGTTPPPSPTNPIFTIVLTTIDAADGTILEAMQIQRPGGVAQNGSLKDPVLNGNGDTVAFVSSATNIGYENPSGADQLVISRKGSGTIDLVSRGSDGLAGNSVSNNPSINFRGEQVGFVTLANNILESSASHPSAVLYSSKTGTLTRLSQNESGVRNNFGVIHGLQINRTGRLAVFIDSSDNYVSGDTNQLEDVFVKDVVKGTMVRVNTSAAGAQSNGVTRDPAIGGTGYTSSTATVAFTSTASSLATVGDGSWGNIYKVSLTFPAPPLTKDTRIESPPDVVVGKKRLTLTLQKFDITTTTQAKKVRATKNSIQYDVRVTKLGSKKGIRRITKTNRVVLRNLPPGKYNVRYRVTGKVDGQRITTSYSPTLTVVVPK